MNLITSVKAWMEAKHPAMPTIQIIHWEKAARKKSSESMGKHFKKHNVPLTRMDSVIENSHGNEAGSNTTTKYLSKTYICMPNINDTFMQQLSQFTNIVEKLFDLETLLEPTKIPSNKKSINLATSMAESILSEWKDVEKGEETVTLYRQRLHQAEAQFTRAHEVSQQSLHNHENYLKERTKQFDFVLQSLANDLQVLFASVKDDRYLASYRVSLFGNYAPLHHLINELAGTIFSSAFVRHDNSGALIIDRRCLTALGKNYNDFCFDPHRQLQTIEEKELNKAREHLNNARQQIESMASQIRAVGQMGFNWQVCHSLFSTQRLTIFSALRRLDAIYNLPMLGVGERRLEVPAVLPIGGGESDSHEPEGAPANSASLSHQ